MIDAVVVGGCGHVGLPLAISLADCGLDTISFDRDATKVQGVNSGIMPFLEKEATPVLVRVLESGRFRASTKASDIVGAQYLIVVIGTPVDDHMNPDPNSVVTAMSECIPYMDNSQTVILRSTVFPGVTRKVETLLASADLDVDVAFCPERIVEGQAMRELRELPQIVGVRNSSAGSKVSSLFKRLGVETLEVLPEEAELAKLFTNTWRYIKFAAANQFWLMANEAGLDFARIREAIVSDYPRAADMPGPGFAAGPCLYKDTAQLAAFTNNNFALGNAAMMVNEGLPLYVVDRISRTFRLDELTVGILGMAFKAQSDDTRSSLSYKLKRILKFRAKEVLASDPYVTSDPSLVPLEEVLAQADLCIIGAPHPEYREIDFAIPVVDIWNLMGQGSRI